MLYESLTNKRFVLIFASIFMLGAMPLMMSQPNGAASAGLSLGFSFPIEHGWHLLVMLLIGIYASVLRANAVILVPLAFVLLYLVGMSTYLDHARYSMLPMFMLGSILLFALSMAVADNQRCMVGLVISASVGFHFGRHYSFAVPDIASPIYFMIGNILAFALVFATAVSFGVTLRNDHIRKKELPESDYLRKPR